MRKEQAAEAEKDTLERLRRMEASLIANIAHETKTPLAVLSGYAELIAGELREKDVDEQTAKDLDNIAEEAQRVSRLMDELNSHTLAKDDSPAKTRLCLTGIIEGAARLYTPILERGENTLAVRLPDGLPDVYACAGEVTHVLFNLLQNARNHTDNGEANHVGIVESVSGGMVNTIEGNTSDSVARRSYELGSVKIIGYGIPLFSTVAD